jgi:proteasome lid subunit RPN8/RPN11
MDKDRLLPHNLARHAAWDENLVGWTKVEVARLMDERLRERATPMQTLKTDAARRKAAGDDPVETALADKDVVLDMAASVAVSRRLARDGGAGGRRLSIFLSPTGLDLIVLAEDAERQVRLDELEMGYYAAVAGDAILDGHLTLPAGRRYARSCRERSSLVPQTAVALHAAIATERVLAAFADTEASATVWRLDRESMQVTRISLDARPMRRFAIEGWTVMVCERLLDELADRRAERLPSETGGVLLGDFDLDRKLVYVVHHLPAPPDSVEEPSGFVRGADGLDLAIAAVGDRTLGMLRYVGEWHSHPDGVRARPSGEDVLLYVHLALEMEIEDRPAIMLIAGAGEFGVVAGLLERGE